MDPSLLNLLDTIGKNSSASDQEADGKEKQKNSSGEEVIEMANNNTLFVSSSSSAEIESTNVNLSNQEAGKMKMEPAAVEENGQSSNNNGESFRMEQPISFQLKATTIPLVTSPCAEKIYIGANFSSFAEFERAFEEWKHIFHHPFRVASSEKHKDTQLAERFKYRCVVYHCSRYGEKRKRGADKRPYQNYLPCGCNAILRLNFHAQNGGSLCVTKLFTEHNHDPETISEDITMNGRFGMKHVKKNSPENELGELISLNSTVSSIAATNADDPPFSPLISLQSAGLHHSPSSGGQSSSEGANNDDVLLGIDRILNGLISPQAYHYHRHQQNSQHYLAKSSTMASSSIQSGKQHNILTGNAVATSSMLTSALNNQLQQITSTSSSSSSATPQTPNSSAMTLLQLQALINFFKHSSKQQQQQTPKSPTIFNPNAQHLLEQFFNGAGHQQAQQRNFQLAAERGLGDGHHSRESAKSRGQEIVQEADLLLQMLIDQMLRCHDLGAYLRRLRQFLRENYQ